MEANLRRIQNRSHYSASAPMTYLRRFAAFFGGFGARLCGLCGLLNSRVNTWSSFGMLLGVLSIVLSFWQRELQ